MYYQASEELCKAFYEKYYWDEEDGEYFHHKDDFYMIGDMKSQWLDTVWIGDQYWELTNIQTALINNMDKDIVWGWYDKYIDQYDHTKKNEEWYKQWVNLWHYWLNKTWKPMYSKKEIEMGEKAVKKAQALFNKEIEKYKKV